jgi:hypothetical protein
MDSYAIVSDRPGLGVELDEDAIRRYRESVMSIGLTAGAIAQARILTSPFTARFSTRSGTSASSAAGLRTNRGAYPMVYFFHGWGERHNRPPRQAPVMTRRHGSDTIAAFVARDVIVVKWDGASPRQPGEDYVRPYNISPVGETDRQFRSAPGWFAIDSRFGLWRTGIPRHGRPVHGRFMSYWIAGKHPHLVGSASNFMGSQVRSAPGSSVEYRQPRCTGTTRGCARAS